MADAESNESITARGTAAREVERSDERSAERSADNVESAKARELRTTMEGTGIVSRDWVHIDMALWDHGVDLDDGVAPVAATTYIAHQLADYTYRRVVDDDLFGDFITDFAGWSEMMFLRAYPNYIKRLKAFLRARGVYMRTNLAPSAALAGLLSLEDCPQWPEAQLARANIEPISFTYTEQQRLLQELPLIQPTPAKATVEATPRSETVPQHAQEKPVVDSIEGRGEDQPVRPQSAHPRVSTTHGEPRMLPPSDHGHGARWDTPYTTSDLPAVTPAGTQPQHMREAIPEYPQRPAQSVPPPAPWTTNDPYIAIPPVAVRNSPVEASTIMSFAKMWDRTKNYTGKPYDLLDDKLKIFYNICYHASIRPSQFHAVFPRILSGRAEDYYIHYVSPQEETFTAVCIRSLFVYRMIHWAAPGHIHITHEAIVNPNTGSGNISRGSKDTNSTY